VSSKAYDHTLARLHEIAEGPDAVTEVVALTAPVARLLLARLGTNARPPLSSETAARFMESVISDISETTWCAGWCTGVEYAVWHYLQVGTQAGSWLDVTAEQADDLRALSQMAGGWVAWEGEGMASGPRFVPLAEWARRYREWLAAVEARKPKGDSNE